MVVRDGSKFPAHRAGRLQLSPHTVRDDLKAVFEKVGVSSRGELVAKRFAEQCARRPATSPTSGT
jgi:DNA-binding CsgD family transcriptional regulator